MTRLVTVAHGTRHATGNDVARALTAAAAERLGCTGVATYVELCEPLLADVARRGDVVVPLLLSTGYHVRHDLPAAAGPAALGRPLGPDALLARAQVDRLEEAGADRGAPLVMVAAGSSDPLATRDQARAGELLAEAWGAPVRLATMSGIGARPAEVVRPGDVVSTYLLSDGYFATRAAEQARCAGAEVVSSVIGVHPAVVELVVQRTSALAEQRASA